MAKGRAWTEEEKQKIIRILEPYFKLGYKRNKACILASVPSSTLQDWIDQDETLRIKIESWQNSVSAKARENKAKEVLAGDSRSSEWWLERMDDDFKPKQKIEHEGGVDVGLTPDMQAKIDFLTGNDQEVEEKPESRILTNPTEKPNENQQTENKAQPGGEPNPQGSAQK